MSLLALESQAWPCIVFLWAAFSEAPPTDNHRKGQTLSRALCQDVLGVCGGGQGAAAVFLLHF